MIEAIRSPARAVFSLRLLAVIIVMLAISLTSIVYPFYHHSSPSPFSAYAAYRIPKSAAPVVVGDPNLKVETVFKGLQKPTSMAFLGPNDILVLEKDTGIVKRVKNDVILPAPLLDLNVVTSSERGMLGIDVKRRGSSTTQFDVFLYYTLADDSGNAIANRLSKYILTIDSRLGPAQGRMSHVSTLLNLPATPGPNHDGGKVAIDPDANVYTVIGDLNRRTQAQNVETGASPDGTGGILRVT
jgi:glucose/arabinose dehydrogenase